MNPAIPWMGAADSDTTKIRPVLNAYLEKFGGHIGYCVAPSERRKGYATQMLHDILPLCKELGIELFDGSDIG